MTVGWSENLRSLCFCCSPVIIWHLDYPPVRLSPLRCTCCACWRCLLKQNYALFPWSLHCWVPVVCRIQAWPTRSFVTWVQLLLQPRGYHPALLISGLTNLPSLLDHAILLYRLSPLHKLFPRSDSTFTSNSVPWDPVQISPPLQVPRPVSALVPRRLVQSCFNI